MLYFDEEFVFECKHGCSRHGHLTDKQFNKRNPSNLVPPLGKPLRSTIFTSMSNSSEMRTSFTDRGNNTGSDQASKISTVEAAVVTALYIVLVLAILVGNGVVLVVFTVNKRLRSLANLLIRSLAVSDLSAGLVTCPCWIYIFVSEYSDAGYSPSFYQFYITADILFGGASILQLTSFSIERCHAIARPFRHRLLSKKVFVAMVAVPWLLASVVASLQPVQFARWTNVYTIVTAVLCFFVPFAIICLAYAWIFKVTRSQKNLGCRRLRNKQQQQQREITLAVTVATITGLFAISWLPLFVVTVIASFHASYLPSPLWTDRLLKFVKFCHYGNSALNPIIYAFRNKELRGAFSQLACRQREAECGLESTKSLSVRSKQGSSKSSSRRSERCTAGKETRAEPVGQAPFMIESAV